MSLWCWDDAIENAPCNFNRELVDFKGLENMSWLLPFTVLEKKIRQPECKAGSPLPLLLFPSTSSVPPPPSTTIEEPGLSPCKIKSVKLEHAELTKKPCFCHKRAENASGNTGQKERRQGQKDKTLFLNHDSLTHNHTSLRWVVLSYHQDRP